MVVSRNGVAVFIWVFTAVYGSAVGMMVYLLWRDGIPQGASAPQTGAIVGAFVLATGLLVWLSCTRACTTVKLVAPGRLHIAVIYPHRWLRAEVPLRDAQPAYLVETEDSEGDPYFQVQLPVGYPFSEAIKVAEGSRAHCEQVLQRFNQLR